MLNVEVVTVSRLPEKIFQTAAAVHVITAEDIHRSGATSIPELLRQAPGLGVTRINDSKYAISSRHLLSLINDILDLSKV